MVKNTVLPGEFLSTEEEFEPGKNAFAENGEILADSIGNKVEDGKQKIVLVEKAKDVSSVKVNDLVIGEVIRVRDNSVSLSICPEPAAEGRVVLLHTRVSLPIRLVSRDYIKNLKGMFKIGDLVKAKIFKILPYGTDVKTSEPELGVIRAFCSNCRQPLHLFSSQLKCLSCGNTEQRKLSSEYSLK